MIKALMNKELPVIPDEIHRAIENSAVSATEFENKNDNNRKACKGYGTALLY